MTREEIIAKANSMQWYHPIKLLPDFTTTTFSGDFLALWNMIRSVRFHISYGNKAVIDLGTWNGMWAFEAEELGACQILGIDNWTKRPAGLAQCEFAAAVKHSKVVFKHLDVHNAFDALKPQQFDIVQNLGLLYHLQNPILALNQMRKLCKTGGVMLMETAYWDTKSKAPMMRGNGDNGIYHDASTFWAPNPECLKWMLRINGWSMPVYHADQRPGPFKRLCWICIAL